METKKEIRQRLLQERRSCPEDVRRLQSEEIARQILAHPAYQSCGTLFSYVPFRQEADTWPVMRSALSAGKRLAVPRVNGKEMSFFLIQGEEDLIPGSFGIREPKESCRKVYPAPGDVMLLPGAAFDLKGHRIGYGGGYYDRYLFRYPQAFTLGVCFDFQLLGALPAEAFDQTADAVICPGGNRREESE